MKFGCWTPLPHITGLEPHVAIVEDTGPDHRPDRAFQFAVDVGRKAESYGFETTLVAQRWLGPDLDSLILGAGMAAQTRSLEIMTAIHPGIMAPQVVAKMGATLDRISGGRFAVNIVNGWWKDEFELYGNGGWLEDTDERYVRMDEFIRVIKGLWSEDKFTFRGKYYSFENGELPTKPKHQPVIYAASRSDAGKNTIAELGDVWFAAYQAGRENYEANLEQMKREIGDMHERAAKFGRTIQCGISANVVCSRNPDEVQAKLDQLESFGKQGRIPFISVSGLGAGLIGAPEFVAERIARYESIGLDLLMLKFFPMLDGIDQFGTEVMPLVDGPHRNLEQRKSA